MQTRKKKRNDPVPPLGRLFALLTFLFIIVLVGGDGNLRAQSPASGKAHIVLSTVSANYREGLMQLAQEYERLHPGVSVTVQIQPVNGYETWLRTQIESKSDAAPDIYNINYTNGYYERGLLVNLTPFISAQNPYTGKPWRDNLDAQFLEKYKSGGDVATIPLDFIEVAFFYNKGLFARLGLQPPHTWEEMLATAQKVKAAGYIPFAVPGDTDSYWSGAVGWIFRFFTDAYMRDAVPQVMARPGDWDYDPRKNADFHLNGNDPYNDATVVVNPERLLLAVRDRQFRMDSPRFREAYRKIAEFAQYWQPGFNGTSANSAYQLFLTQKAAMMINTSTTIATLARDMDDLYPQDRFDWDLFPIPPMTQSAFHIPPFRGVGGAGVVFGIVKKSDEQTQRTVDFLMYLTTPHATQTLVAQAVRARQPINGPMLIPGAQLPEQMARRFSAFEHRGFEKLSFRGLADEQESVWKWTVWAQRYLDGRISVDDCLAHYQQVMEEAVPRVARQMNYDLDPRTKDPPKP
ncbi:MAG TPA: extracellular solute-binding protein [Chthonomonadaceae bacterium]|nr:extracellular solute-binding protein [Chthonomonadaceae bacterium]